MNQKKKKKLPFKKVESYKHKLAKDVLREWFEPYFGVEYEKEFYIDGRLTFVADVALSNNNILSAIYEITNKNPLNGHKLGMIQYWCYRNSTPIDIYEIGADYILNKTEKPYIIGTQIL